MLGDRFGRWTVIGEAPLYVAPNGRKNRAWLCRCDCGVERVVVQMRLRRGDSKSCGCHKLAVLSKIKRSHGHHVGGAASPTMNSWKAMRQRCEDAAHPHYANYGGRDIKVCKRWRKFENFLADMGERPEGLTLDRIDSDGDYEPGNCRWATRIEQRHNRRDTRAAA